MTHAPRFSWIPRAACRLPALLTISLAAACSSDLTTPADSPLVEPAMGGMARSLKATADYPVVREGEFTALRADGARPVAGTKHQPAWRVLDGGDLKVIEEDGEPVTTFSADAPGTYRIEASNVSLSLADTTTITVVSASLTSSITSLVIRPLGASIRPNDTLRYAVWGRTAAGDSVPAPARIYPSRGYIRGMDYFCPIEGTFNIDAVIEGTSIRAATTVTVTASAPAGGTTPEPEPEPTPPPSGDVASGDIVRIEMTPFRDTIPVNDTLTFRIQGVTSSGARVPVAVQLHPDRGYAFGTSYHTPIEGTFMIRALQKGGTLADTAFITVKYGAPPAQDYTAGSPTEPAPEPEPTPEPEPEPSPSPSPAPTPTVAELPRVYLDSRYVPPTGRVISVPAGGALQTAINSAARGDVIELAAGATYTGNFVLPAKSGSGWVTLRTAGTLPAEGTRVTPSSAAGFAKIVTPNSMPALRTSTSSSVSQYRIMGLEFKSSASMTYAIVDLGDYSNTASSVSELPGALVLDRLYIHGNGTQDIQRCVALNSRSTAIVDSWIANCHYRYNESQGIVGWNGPGPYKIVNNHIEGASENLMFGGADPKFTNLVASDIEIRRNHFFKPTSIQGRSLAIKNLLEVKNGQRILIEGNIFENNWAEGQTGFAVVLKSQNQSGRCTWCVTQDITWRYNRISNSPSGFNILAVQALDGGGAVPAKRIDIRHTVFDRVGQLTQPGDQRIFQVLGNVTKLTIEHNTAVGQNHIMMFDGGPASDTDLVIRNNIFARGRWGVFGSSYGEGNPALNYYARGGTFDHNVLIGASTSLYPSGNHFPSTTTLTGLLNLGSLDYRLSTSSPYYTAASDGTMMGADVAQLDAMLAGVK